MLLCEIEAEKDRRRRLRQRAPQHQRQQQWGTDSNASFAQPGPPFIPGIDHTSISQVGPTRRHTSPAPSSLHPEDDEEETLHRIIALSLHESRIPQPINSEHDSELLAVLERSRHETRASSSIIDDKELEEAIRLSQQALQPMRDPERELLEVLERSQRETTAGNDTWEEQIREAIRLSQREPQRQPGRSDFITLSAMSARAKMNALERGEEISSVAIESNLRSRAHRADDDLTTDVSHSQNGSRANPVVPASGYAPTSPPTSGRHGAAPSTPTQSSPRSGASASAPSARRPLRRPQGAHQPARPSIESATNGHAAAMGPGDNEDADTGPPPPTYSFMASNGEKVAHIEGDKVTWH